MPDGFELNDIKGDHIINKCWYSASGYSPSIDDAVVRCGKRSTSSVCRMLPDERTIDTATTEISIQNEAMVKKILSDNTTKIGTTSNEP
ncbi:hypothetical protein H257_16540 [Aphanomyces astaci]|uniref:Uncharacterized protein n=1 Tax=Aphanomyces astaci TaxID=112090 RepID=W4FI33_APHAT|nr:hypothetical protein H257_16540 [Aphanomyces astaci]ETV67130.1 hypothetical protein H257_16540 [Aphanomyces astaci]|eukprot:XP_009843295.1 hypothetical protein H257_16540 [Aphanomyces astaci]